MRYLTYSRACCFTTMYECRHSSDRPFNKLAGKKKIDDSTNKSINPCRKCRHSPTRNGIWVSPSFSNSFSLSSIAPLLRYIYASLCLFLCVPKRFRQHISPRAPKKLIEQNKNPNGAVVIIGLGFPCQCVCLFCALLR